jgi:hypothetical protein
VELISDIAFERGGLPAGWIDEARRAHFADGLMHDGGKARPSWVVPGRWQKLAVEINVDPGDDGIVEFGTGRVMLQVDFRCGRHRASAHEAATLALHKQLLPRVEGQRVVRFTFDQGNWQASVDGEQVLAYSEPGATAIGGRVQLAFWSGCAVQRVQVSGDQPCARQQPQPRADNDFELQVTVDFPDDLSYAPYTRDMLDQLFAEYAKWGVRRCHWIYDGTEDDHWWDFFTEPRHRNYLQTLENFGGDLFATAVEAAHAYDIEMIGVFKPFEMAYMLHTYAETTAEAARYGRFSRLGGVIYRAPDVTVARRDLMTRRRPGAWGESTTAFTRIDLVGYDADAPAFDPAAIQIWLSDDNISYSLYTGPCETADLVEDYPIYTQTADGGRPGKETRRARVLRLTGLDLDAPFVAIVAPADGASFGNVLLDLVHVFGANGEERCLTLGIVPRAGQLSYDIVTATTNDSAGLDFCSRGIEFDNVEGSPSACLTGYEGMREWHTFDGAHRFIGIARGKEETAVGVMSPALPDTHDIWLSWIDDILAAGADGVEIRVRNHHTHLAWEEFGYEQAVRAAFFDRHGVDIWRTDDFDRPAWRRLRGESYTDFYRLARRRLTACGKPLGLHISRTMDIEPEQGASMGFHFDWRTWLDEGLADSVTMKEVWPQTVFAEEVLARARPHGTRLIFSPFANALWSRPDGVEVCRTRIQQARAGGFDGFQLYESCCVMRAHADGRLTLREPALRALFAREFCT